MAARSDRAVAIAGDREIDRVLLHFLGVAKAPRGGAPSPGISADDWLRLAQRAIRLGVAPLLYARIEAASPRPQCPSEAHRLLRGYYLQTAVRNLRLYECLARLLQAFAHEGIAVIVLKGAFLAQIVYGTPALRSMGDVDLLVARSDLARTENTLIEMGCGPCPRPSIAAQTAAGHHHLLPFELEGFSIEVHWSIEEDDNPFAIDVDGLWQRARPATIAGTSALALAPEDLLLHLCLHASYEHGGLSFSSGLRPLCDVAEVVRHYAADFDWPAFALRARQWKIASWTWLTLSIARDLLQADIPDTLLERLAPERIDPHWAAAARDLALCAYYDDVIAALPALGPAWLNTRWRHLGAAARLRWHLFPPRAVLARAYPSLVAAGPLVLPYLARWKDVAVDLARLALRRDADTRALLQRERRRIALLGWLESPAR